MDMSILDKEQTLTFAEARTLLHTSMDDLLSKVWSGQIKTVRVGQVNKIPVSELQEHLGKVTVMSIAEGADALGVSYEVCRKLVQSGLIPSIRKSNRVFILKPNAPDARDNLLAEYNSQNATESIVSRATVQSGQLAHN